MRLLTALAMLLTSQDLMSLDSKKINEKNTIFENKLSTYDII